MTQATVTAKLPSTAPTTTDIPYAGNDGGSPLTADITATATTIPVQELTNYPNDGPFVIRIGNERILCTSKSASTGAGNLITTLPNRGYDNSAATTHKSGARAMLALVAYLPNRYQAELIAIGQMLTGALSFLHGLTVEATAGTETALTLIQHDESSATKVQSWKREATGVTTEVAYIGTDGALDLVTGALKMGGTTLFENDRDLAVTLLPNANATLDLGSTGRHWNWLYTDNAFTDPKGSYTVVVYVKSGTYYARRADGTVLASSASPSAVVQAAIDDLPTSTVSIIDGGGVVILRAGSYADVSVSVQKHNVTIQGEGWGTLFTRTAANPFFKLEAVAADASLYNFKLKDMQLEGGSYSSPAVTNMHAGTTFIAGSDISLQHVLISDVRFKSYGVTNVIELRNPDNRCLVDRNWFTSVSAGGCDIYFESNGHAGGNISVRENELVHGAATYGVRIVTINKNIRRVSIENNSTVWSIGGGATAFSIERTTGGFTDHLLVRANSVEDALVGVNISGAGATTLVTDVLVLENSFFYRPTVGGVVEAGQAMVKLNEYAEKVTVQGNRFNGPGSTAKTAYTGTIVAISDGNASLTANSGGANVALQNTFKFLDTKISGGATGYQWGNFAETDDSAWEYMGAGDLRVVSATAVTDGALINSPAIVLRALYDSDATAGITRATRDAKVQHVITAGGASPASKFSWIITSTTVATLTDAGALDILGGFSIGGVSVFESDRDLAIALLPNADNTLDLGSASRQWNDIFLGGTIVVSGTVLFESDRDLAVSLLPNAANSLNLGSASVYFANTFTRVLTFHNSGAGSDPSLASSSGVTPGNLTLTGGFVVNQTNTTPQAAFQLTGTALSGAGTRNSHYFQQVGYAHDGVVAHTTTWRYRALVTSQAGASTLELASDIDGGGYTSRLTVTDAGVVDARGGLNIAGTVVFESDRDLAITLLPNADATLNLGSAAREWANAWLSANLTLGGDVVLSRGAADRLDLASGDSLNIVLGNLQIAGTTLFENDRDLSVSLLPNANATLDLGSTTRNFANAYLNRTAGSVLFMGASGLVTEDNANLFWDDASNRLGIGTNAPSSGLHIYKSTAGTSNTVIHEHADNTNAASHATVRISVGGGSGGDPSITQIVTGGLSWAFGVDNSDSDAWVLSEAATLGTSNRLRVATGGNVDIVAGSLLVGSTTLFENDRDIAVSLLPNADNSLTSGTAARRWASVNAVLVGVYGAASDANPRTQLGNAYIAFGPGGATAIRSYLFEQASDVLAASSDGSTVNGTFYAQTFKVKNQGAGADPTLSANSSGQSMQVAANWNPNADNTYNMGNSGKRWTTIVGQTFQVFGTLNDANAIYQADSSGLRAGAGGASAVDITLARGAANRWDMTASTGLNLVDGSLLIAGTILFENDRDLAVSLLPNADNSLNLGSSTRTWAQAWIRTLKSDATGMTIGGATSEKLGFYGASPVVRDATAFTQTYATASHTHAADTATDMATTAATNVTPFGFTTAAQADAIATKFNALRVDVDNIKQFVNALVDTLQSYGLVG